VISPQFLFSTDEVKNLATKDRSCRFDHEHKDYSSTMFTIYNHKSCLFECVYNQALDNCGCVPWKYPSVGTSKSICDSYGNMCWDTMFLDGNVLQNCTSCHYDCTKITYPFFTNKQELKAEDCVSKQIVKI
jgi:hypothetical protein